MPYAFSDSPNPVADPHHQIPNYQPQNKQPFKNPYASINDPYNNKPPQDPYSKPFNPMDSQPHMGRNPTFRDPLDPYASTDKLPHNPYSRDPHNRSRAEDPYIPRPKNS